MSKIGIFDSGVGGLSVLRCLLEKRPDAEYVYFADTARVPYGVRAREEVFGFVREIAEHLKSEGCGAVVAACATATSTVPRGWDFGVPFVGAIEPAASAACRATQNKSIALIATDRTVISGVFEQKIKEIMPDASVLAVKASPLVPYVERGEFSSGALTAELEKILGEVNRSDADVLILGCTHFPIIKDEIRRVLDDRIGIVDVGEQTALAALHLAAPSGEPKASFETSGGAEEFRAVAERILNKTITVAKVK